MAEHDAMIRCANGCGAVLSLKRLREGWRSPHGVTCERCVVEREVRRLAKLTELPEAEQEAFAAKGIAWVMGDEDPDAGAHHG